MSDYKSGLPVRSEADGLDERLQTKIVDASNPDTQQLEIDTDGNAHAEMHGNDPASTDRVLRLSETGALTPDGVYDVTNNTLPGNVGLILHSRAATPDETNQIIRPTAIQGSTDNTIYALDMALHDEAGNAYSATNPLPVAIGSSEGDEVVDYDQAVAVVKDASANHDYTVTALKTLVLDSVECSASGRAKFELQVETGVATGIYETKLVGFNSIADPNVELNAKKRISVAAGVIVRLVKTNLDNQAQDLYSTILGVEV